LVDQIRRSSRSVSANIAEATKKRRYEKHFVLKLTDSDAENSQTQVWLEYSLACEYRKRGIFYFGRKKCRSGEIIKLHDE
jgi:four helix bundle protein